VYAAAAQFRLGRPFVLLERLALLPAGVVPVAAMAAMAEKTDSARFLRDCRLCRNGDERGAGNEVQGGHGPLASPTAVNGSVRCSEVRVPATGSSHNQAHGVPIRIEQACKVMNQEYGSQADPI